MNDLEFLKELYHKELERKDKINAKISFPISLTTLILGGIFYCILNSGEIEQCYRIYFFISLTISTASLIFATYFISRCIIGLKFGYLPIPSRIFEYKKNLYAYYKQDRDKNEENYDLIVNNEFDQYLQETFIQLTDNNIVINDKKNQYLLNSTYTIVFSIPFLFISFLFLYQIILMDN